MFSSMPEENECRAHDERRPMLMIVFPANQTCSFPSPSLSVQTDGHSERVNEPVCSFRHRLQTHEMRD